jgi:arginyl-tRNA synthetase
MTSAHPTPSTQSGGRESGPAERALTAALQEHLRAVAPHLRIEGVEVEAATKNAPGDFRIDLRPLLPAGEQATKDESRKAAELVSSAEWVEQAVGVPPRVYFTPRLDVLAATVVDGIEAERRTYGTGEAHRGEKIVVSFNSPNANKALHLGHLRVCFMGMGMANLLDARGYETLRSEMLSNYGIHICQAIAAYRRWGEGSTPDSTGMKGDHFVAKWYAMFHARLAEVPELEDEAAKLLQDMEAGNDELLAFNAQFTEWSIQGIYETYERIGTFHDFRFRELDTLPIAMRLIAQALLRGDCLRRSDGSVYVDLEDKGLGTVTILRRDGTPLVFTQLLAVWVRREQLHPHHTVMHVTGDQWTAGVNALLEILKRFGCERAGSMTEGVYFGMVKLPEGKMRSREGIVVGADTVLDRMRDRMIETWLDAAPGPLDHLQRDICETLGLAVVKYWLLGFKRPAYITYDEDVMWEEGRIGLARIVRALRRAERAGEPDVEAADPPFGPSYVPADRPLSKAAALNRRELVQRLNDMPRVVAQALDRRDPADVVNYMDDVCRRVSTCDRQAPLDAATWRAVRVVLLRALQIADITLPPGLRYLPPPFGIHDEPAEDEEQPQAAASSLSST